MSKLTVDELKTILKDEVGFSDEQLAGLTKPSLEKLAQGYMRQADYDRVMNENKAALAAQQAEIDKAKAELKGAEDRLNNEIAEWTTTIAKGHGETEAMRTRMAKAEQAALVAKQKIESLATRHGFNAAEVLKDLETGAPAGQPQPAMTQPTHPQQPAADLDKFREQVTGQINGLADVMLTLPAELAALQHEHHELTGEWLDPRNLIQEVKDRAAYNQRLGGRGEQKSMDVRSIWMEQHNIEQRRADKAKADYDAALAAAREEGRQAALSDFVPGNHTPTREGAGSVVLHRGTQPLESKLQRPQPNDRLQSAVNAFRTGRYRQTAQEQPKSA